MYPLYYDYLHHNVEVGPIQQELAQQLGNSGSSNDINREARLELLFQTEAKQHAYSTTAQRNAVRKNGARELNVTRNGARGKRTRLHA